MPNNVPYRVSWSRTAVASLNELVKRTSDPSRRTELARVVRTIDDQLRQAPIAFGEVYHVRGTIEEHLAALEFLAVDFAVDTARKFVLVRKARALSGYGA
jgi:hypothetical protein